MSKRQPQRCGFCSTGNHASCNKATRWHNKIWVCACADSTCVSKPFRCFDCASTTHELAPSLLVCTDRAACADRAHARLVANPTIQHLNTLKEKRMSETTTDTKPAKAPKEPTFCLVTGEPTAGGKFRPGMDARYVSLRVAEVVDGAITEEDQAKRLETDGISDALTKKYQRSLQLSRETADAKAAKAKERAEAQAKRADEKKTRKPADEKQAEPVEVDGADNALGLDEEPDSEF